jgi:hypothetical protein
MKCFFTLVLLVSSGTAFAWGNTGHRTVGEVATKYLEGKTLKKITDLLKGEGLARAATWPDEIKSEPETYQHTYHWHYTTWPQEASEHSESNENSESGVLLKSISEQLTVLKDSKATKEQKIFALRFIVHLVGDLHMPLHVGAGTDQGGNLCKVSFHGRAMNLHSLWDEGMIEFTKLSYTELANFISAGKSAKDLKAIAQGSVIDWARESKEIVPSVYPLEITPSQGPSAVRSYCKKDVQPEETPKLSFEYSYKFMPIVEQRLFKAGVRLAVLLNENLK